jgi:hypothetical protein
VKLMFAALIRAAERWRGLRFSEFELRQIAAVRKELDVEYEATITSLGHGRELGAHSPAQLVRGDSV